MNVSERTRRNTEEIKRAAEGRWDDIYSRLAPELAPALARVGRHVTCPFHGGKDDFRLPNKSPKHPSFTLHGTNICTCGIRDGFETLMTLRGWDFPTTLEQVQLIVGGGIGSRPINPAPTPARPEEDSEQVAVQDERIKRRLKAWWSETVPLDHPSALPARRYFKNRELGELLLPISDIAFHPGLEYYCVDARRSLGKFPAIISIVRSADGTASTVHRTYITPDGRKADVPSPRKLYSSPSTNPVSGGAIKIDPANSPILHVGEGLESSLAARAIIGAMDPVWSAVNKELLASLAIPEHVQLVVVWADRDANYGGQVKAIDLMDRVRATGRRAVVMIPPFKVPDGDKSVDWNDVVASIGLTDIRAHFNVVKLMRGIAKVKSDIGLTGQSSVGSSCGRAS